MFQTTCLPVGKLFWLYEFGRVESVSYFRFRILNMRIISGKYKGRVIRIPEDIRPTQQKVRKAIFDILGDIEGLFFLELFAGSGAVGLEALSQGAKEVVFVENDTRCVEKIKENLSLLNSLSYRVIELDAFRAIEQLAKRKERFDIIFFDPPYYQDLSPHQPYYKRKVDNWCGSVAKNTLQTLEVYDILAPNGFIIVQHFKKDILPDKSGNLTVIREARYGDSLISFYKKNLP
jgi:16S rRNA (guanine966-N2)-methyltransferase